MTKWELEPTSEQIQKYKLPNGLNSNADAEYRALIENMKEAMQAIYEEDLSPEVQTIHAVLSLLLDRS